MPDSLRLSGLHCTGHRDNEVPAIFHDRALVMVIRNMRNGVDRLESWSVTGLAEAKALTRGGEYEVLDVAMGARYAGLMTAARGCLTVFVGGLARGLDDGRIELVAWLPSGDWRKR